MENMLKKVEKYIYRSFDETSGERSYLFVTAKYEAK